MPIVFELPVPPSVNSIWRQGNKKVYLNPKYVAWIQQCDLHITASGGVKKLGAIKGRFRALLQINEKMVRPDRDLDNCNKVPLDYCKRLGLIENDSLKFCRSVTVEIDETGNPSTLGCRITLTPIAAPQQF